jgi:hypothetical protein
MNISSSFVNYQVRSNDAVAVATAVRELILGRAYVSPAKAGWVSVYDEKSETQDAHEIGWLGIELSARLNTAVIAFLVSESTLFVYYLFNDGDLVDEYHSTAPPSNVQAGADEQFADQKFRFMGRPDELLKLCAPGTQRRDIEQALLRNDSLMEGGFAASLHPEERLHPLATALQIDDLRIMLGFADVDRLKTGIADGDSFVKIDNRKIRRSTSPRIPPRY